MIIRKVKIKNFRGYTDKTIHFQDKTVVLLAAANGIGKTTVVDAIEWCLTGDIRRLKEAFDSRSTNTAERKLNTNGILKNREADDKEKVEVVLWLYDGEKERILKREQKKDELDKDSSKATIDNSEELAKSFIQEYVGDSFYNFHFCDVQKSFNIQNTKRTDLDELFSEFITNYDAQKQIATNLDIFAEDCDRYIEDKENQKVSQNEIDNLQKQIDIAREDAKNTKYPETGFYSGEVIDIYKLKRDDLNQQKKDIEKCGYQVAGESIYKLIKNEECKQQQKLIKELDALLENKGDLIKSALEERLNIDTEIITTLEIKQNRLKDLSLSKDTILLDAESVIVLGNEGFSKEFFETEKRTLELKDKTQRELVSEIELLSKNNKMLSLLSNICANKKEVINYRDSKLKDDGVVKCPICGSEAFGIMDEAKILKEAEEYIRLNGEVVKEKEEAKKALIEDIDALYERIIKRAKDVVDKECEVLEKRIKSLKLMLEETQPYFDKVNELRKSREDVILEELNKDNLKVLLDEIENKIIEESVENEVKDTYQKILTVIGYKYDGETLKQTYAKVQNLIGSPLEILNFSYELFVSKINSINSFLSNQGLTALCKKQDENNKKNTDLDREINVLQELKDRATQRAEGIRNLIEELSGEEYKKVGPVLCKFYNKLARFNFAEGIKVVQENDGITLTDDKDKNIVNVLSNGQISVFMLAHFFAGISARNKHERMKVYFIDDLTACMDDVNMLAFMDLLKYQMSSKETMEQLFFVTCDDRISRLFRYKMNGRGIELCELNEADLL